MKVAAGDDSRQPQTKHSFGPSISREQRSRGSRELQRRASRAQARLADPRGCTDPRRVMVAGGHTATNTPDLFRTPKLTVAGPAQYCRGGPGGKRFGCCWLFRRAACIVVAGANYDRKGKSVTKRKGRMSPNEPERMPRCCISKSQRERGHGKL